MHSERNLNAEAAPAGRAPARQVCPRSGQWRGPTTSGPISRSAWLALLLLFCTLSGAEPDDTQQAWLDRVDLPAHWDNVEGAPEWIAGAIPEFRPARLLHTVMLDTGENITVRVAAGERLRLQLPDAPINPGWLTIDWSNGSGLFASLEPTPHSDGSSLLVTPLGAGENLVRVRNEGHRSGPLELALFVSRDANRLTATSYRDQMVPVSPATRVRLDDGMDHGDYWQVDPERPLAFDLRGSTRIRIDSRLLLPDRGGPYADSYRISAYLDGEAWRVLDLATLLDTTGAIAVDRCNRPIGRRAQAYLEIPDGAQRLELRARRPILIRLLARQQATAYLYPGNLPLDYQATVGSAGSQDSTPYFWGPSDAELRNIRDRLAQPDSVTYLDAVRVAHNNAHRLGGLSSLAPLAAWARRYPGQGSYQALAARRQLLHTFYRDLMPLGAVSDTLFAWFPTPQLAMHPGPLFFTRAYADSMAGNLAGGFFSTLAATPDQALEFLLPEQTPLTSLRVALDRTELSASQTLLMQLGGAPPMRLQVEPARAVHPNGFRPNSGMLGLSLLQHGQDAGSDTLSGPFGSRHAAAPLADVSFIELPVPANTQRLKLWRADAGGGPLRVALAYRTSGWYRMSEAGYLGLLEAVGEAEVLRQWQQALSAYEGAGEPPPAVASAQQDMLADLGNQWLPLLRFLHARYRQLASWVNQVDNGVNHSPEADLAEMAAAVRQVQLAVQAGEWQSALEQWSAIRRVSDGARQAQARSGQIEALMQLGDLFLAKQLLRHDLLYAGQAALQRQALERLIGIAEREGDLEGVVTLRAVWAILDPQAAALNDLAAALTATGRGRYALLVLLAVPSRQRPAPLVLSAAYAEGWWRLFDETLAASPDPRLQALWRGYRAQLEGDFEGALESWRSAGQKGASLADHLAEGLRIRDSLDSPKPEQRRRALLQWEGWQHQTPGDTAWQEIPQSVTGHGGVKSLLSTTQWEFSQLFRATPATPVTLAVYGPISLRFQVRPLHASGNGDPINDWITIRSRSGANRYPVIDNRVSPGLQLVRESRPLPGQGVDILYQVPAGFHRLQLDGGQHDVLLKIMARQPRFPLTVLPPLNPFTARAALERWTAVPATAEAVPVRILQRCSAELPLTVHPFAGGGQQKQAEIAVPAAAWFEQLEAHRRHQSQPAVPLGESEPSLAGRLSELLWQAERTPGRYLESLTEAEQLAQGHPTERAGESILRRLRRKASWELVTTAQQSAGVRLVEFSSWHPESPAMKSRKAVMELASDDEQILSGYDSRVLSMYNNSPVELTLDLSMQDIAHLPAQSMRVMLGWDDQPETALLLSPAQPHATLTRRIAAGNHRVRVRIDRPLANQFLRVSVSERRGGSSRLVSEPTRRSYTLATREQPLVLLLQGPTRLRIDEWRDGRTVTSYRSLEAGWQRVVIEVEAGRNEALLRVFRRTLEPEKATVPVRAAQIAELPVAAPLWRTEDLAPQTPQPAAPDLLPLGGQEDGTWSLLSGAVSRRNVDDEPHGGSEEEGFFWVGSAYHYFSADQQTYYQADGQLRLREQGDPVLAIDGSISVRKPEWPLDLDIGGSLLLQNLDYSGQTEYAAALRARVSRSLRLSPKSSHRPSLALFQRWLSLDQLPAEEREEVDQDIFTRYKRDHKQGLRIGDRIDYRPWLDNVLYAGAYLFSNEDLNILDPDHLSLNIGARQLMGDLSLGLDYRWSRYFEDSDREQSDDAQRLRLDLGFSRWFNARRGLQANLRYEYDHDSAASSVFLSFSLDLSNGRYYRDFRPNDLDFRWLRQRRAMERQATTPGSE